MTSHGLLGTSTSCNIPYSLCLAGAVASLSSSAVASLCSSCRRRYGAAEYIAPEDASLSRCRQLPQPLSLPQPVYSYRAADTHYNLYIYRNQSTAIALQIANTTSTFTATSLQLSRYRQPLQPLPLPQPAYSYCAADGHHNLYIYRNQSTAIALQTATTTSTLPQPVYSYHAADNYYTIGSQQGCRRRTAGVPRAHRRRTADNILNNILNNNYNTQTHCRCTADAPQTHHRPQLPQPPTTTTTTNYYYNMQGVRR